MRALTADELVDRRAFAREIGLAQAVEHGLLLQGQAHYRHRVERWHLDDGTAVVCHLPGTIAAREGAFQALYARSAAVCAALAPCGLPVPSPILVNVGQACLIERALPGVTLESRPVALDGEGGRDLIAALARALAAIHAPDLLVASPAARLAPRRLRTSEHDAVRRSGDLGQLAAARDRDGARLLTDAECAALDDLARAALATLPDGYPLPLIHGDFRGANILVDATTHTLTGIIDFEMAGRALPEFDLARFAQRTLLPRAREGLLQWLSSAYAAAAAPPPGFPLRLAWERAEAAAGCVLAANFDASWQASVALVRELAATWRTDPRVAAR